MKLWINIELKTSCRVSINIYFFLVFYEGMRLYTKVLTAYLVQSGYCRLYTDTTGGNADAMPTLEIFFAFV